MNAKTLGPFFVSLLVAGGFGPAAAEAIKCRLQDEAGKNQDFEFEATNMQFSDKSHPDARMLMLVQYRFAEPASVVAISFDIIRDDELGVIAAADFGQSFNNPPRKGVLDGSGSFYYDRKAGKAQLLEIPAADSKAIAYTGTCTG